VKRAVWLVSLAILTVGQTQARAHLLPRPFRLDRLNRHLAGKVIDHTHNHGPDRRIWSAALGEKRDMYVYLPPGYDPCKRYPLALYLHGFREDENDFIKDVVKPIDRAIACGQLPPVIIAVPDGSIHGVSCLAAAGTFFQNSKLGPFEDYVIQDVYGFVLQHYPIRPEPEAHLMLGVSMGGGAAYTIAMKYRHCFKLVAAIFPTLNLRWISCRGRYMDNFDPCCWGWREDFSRGHEVVGRFYGVITVRLHTVINPLYGRKNPNTLALVSANNPIELLDTLDIKPGELEMYVGYGGKDQFNIDAQVESFLYRAREKGLCVGVGYDPKGRHDAKTGLKLLPGLIDWLRPRLEPYSPH
jgi:S-formylglutathione hydrolase FrmB